MARSSPQGLEHIFGLFAFDIARTSRVNYGVLATWTPTATRTPQNNRFNEQKTIALHVRFIVLYISLPSSAIQQREMTKFYVFSRT